MANALRLAPEPRPRASDPKIHDIRVGGWLGITFAVLLFLSAALVSAPGSEGSGAQIATFYAEHGPVVYVAQAIGLVAVAVFLLFARRFNAFAASAAANASRPIRDSALAVAAAAVLTAIPIIALAASSSATSPSSAHTLARLADITDVVLFAAIAVFLTAVA
jgi:hypothetical protein